MSNIINVKEERNVLSFDGEVFNLVANSTNFYLKFELDAEWELNKIVTVIFNFDGQNKYVELDENRMCQIPPTSSSRIWFCITCEPDEVSKLSSTVLSLDVEESGETDTSEVEEYKFTHANLLGLMQELLNGEISAKSAEYADVAGVSQSQVSLTGDEEISGVKNFTGEIKKHSNYLLDCTDVGKPNLIYNGNFKLNEKGSSSYTRRDADIYTVNRWGLFYGNGKFKVANHEVVATDATNPTVFAQFIEDSASLLGKTLAFSAFVNDEKITNIISLPNSFEQDTIINLYECDDYAIRLYFYFSTSLLSLQFVVNNGVTISLDEVKLEVSNFVTKYVEPEKSLARLMCQRYYQNKYLFAVGFAQTASRLAFFVELPVNMRAVTNLSFATMPSYVLNDAVVTASSVEVLGTYPNSVMCYIPASGLEKGKPYLIFGAYIKLDGDYYL